ncbi:MerR family transcriptional regulator [uncultured Muribaculum sp.]|uniref:MerR family transcriptional regulator n=1 Tax=uncultured Muribaculum sp. TaxID=1918613 RepID=UPI00272F11DC|nr:MerR family transcriptional regulator [uncultured Muribaculum sp.]
MTTPKKTYYRIREVVAMLNIPASTLRFWEDTFDQLEPHRTPSGQRRYTPENVEVCKLIKHLLRDKGYSLEYAKRELEAYRKHPPRNDYVCKSVDDALNLLREVTNMVDGNLHAEARIKAVERWISSIEIAEEKPRPPHKNIRGKEYFAQEK